MKTVLLLLAVVLISACNNSDQVTLNLVDINQFNLQKDLYTEPIEVEILGATNLNVYEMKQDFYTLVVARDILTDDTFNILTLNYTNLTDRYSYFVPENTRAAKMFYWSSQDGFKLENNEWPNLPLFSKVFYDNEFISEDVTHFPAIRGLVGNYQSRVNGEETDDLESLKDLEVIIK